MIRNLMLYPAELRGRLRFPPFLPFPAGKQAEQRVIKRHHADPVGHNFGHTGRRFA